MANKEVRHTALTEVTKELKGSYNSLLGVYENSKRTAPRGKAMKQDIETTIMQLERAKLAIDAGIAAGVM